MTRTVGNLTLLLDDLGNKSTRVRRAAAKKLRRLKINEAGTHLLKALKLEVDDQRTWETQYHMIMALGEVEFSESLQYLNELLEREFENKIVYLAIGDSITRLNYIEHGNLEKVIPLLYSKKSNSLLVDGLLRPLSILQLVPRNDEISQIISFGELEGVSENNRAWIASAAAGWEGDRVQKFLEWSAKSNNEQLKKAAICALSNKYPKWDIL